MEYDSDDEGGFRGGKAKVEGSRKSARLSAAPEDKGKMGSEITYKEGYDPKSRGLAEEREDMTAMTIKPTRTGRGRGHPGLVRLIPTKMFSCLRMSRRPC